MAIQFKIQIASMGVINHKPYTHIHLFMLGQNKYGDTLLSKNRGIWERWWPQDAKIEAIHQQEGAIDYVIRKNMPDDQYELLVPFGVKHLKPFFNRFKPLRWMKSACLLSNQTWDIISYVLSRR